MNFTANTLRRATLFLLAVLGLAALAIPATSSHAAVFPSSPATNFAVRIVQGPDKGATLAGALQLTQVGERLIGTLRVAPGDLPLTTRPVVPVVGEVLGRQGVALAFDLGRGQVLQVRLVPAARLALAGLSNGTQAQQWTGQAIGPRPGDVGELIVIHIHIEGKGWSVDIYIKI